MPPRLSPDTYGRSARPARGIVHLGLGAFARAHLGAYTADALEHEPGAWGICGVAERRPDVVRALGPQGGLYTLVERGEEDRLTVLQIVREVFLAPVEPERLAAALADSGVHVVTLTVTEKGYHRAPSGGLADGDEVAADLAGGAPRTAVGQLVAGLARRAREGAAGGVTVLSCDNLPRNGEVLARLVGDFCARLPAGGPGDWIRAHVHFPCTMVDRVVPATTAADRGAVAHRLGLEDRGAVVAEPFRQWVIEAFPGPRPAWERAGALFVDSSAPHEALKLRLLNGTHSLLAYLGGLLGARTVAGAWADPDLVAAAGRLADEDLVPTLPPVPGIDIAEYREQLARRWANPRIGHRLEQIAADGSQKLPARFAAPARERLAAGAPPRWIALALAAWAGHLTAGGGLPVSDPGAAGLREALARAAGPAAQAAALLAAIDDELAESHELGELVTDWLERFAADGARTAIVGYLSAGSD